MNEVRGANIHEQQQVDDGDHKHRNVYEIRHSCYSQARNKLDQTKTNSSDVLLYDEM